MREYDIIIGVEVHAELNTNTKAFCSCRNEFGVDPNSSVCPVCLGLPGAIPILNRQAVESVVIGGLAFGCKINRHSIFERKNFFYPDLSAGYQITQFTKPLCEHGGIKLDSGKFVRINRIHLESDSGKLIHNNEETLIDFNRSGVPLIEIVSEPDLRGVEETCEFLSKLRDTLEFTGVSECRPEKGELRFDVNISVSPKDSIILGTRVEINNLNTFSEVAKAIDYETRRHIEIIERDGDVKRETRGWDEKSGRTYVIRRKESENDYRYFPDPDIPEIEITDEDIARLKHLLPESYEDRVERYKSLGLSDYDIEVLTAEKYISDYFDETLSLTNEPKETANWVMTDVLRVFNESGREDFGGAVSSENLARIIELLVNNEISRASAKILFDEVSKTGKDVDSLIKEISIIGEVSAEEIADIIKNIIKDKPQIVADYAESPEAVAHYFVGAIMKITNGKAEIDIILPLLDEILEG